MEKIASFTVDHDKLEPGIYISRIDGDVTTFDLRVKKPNAGDYMDNRTMHSVEHMIATYIRNSEIGQNVLYFGPMGCQTGFYLLVRNEEPERVLSVLKHVLKLTAEHDGPVFGASRRECGNFANLDLGDAKKLCAEYLQILESKERIDFRYES